MQHPGFGGRSYELEFSGLHLFSLSGSGCDLQFEFRCLQVPRSPADLRTRSD